MLSTHAGRSGEAEHVGESCHGSIGLCAIFLVSLCVSLDRALIGCTPVTSRCLATWNSLLRMGDYHSYLTFATGSLLPTSPSSTTKIFMGP